VKISAQVDFGIVRLTTTKDNSEVTDSKFDGQRFNVMSSSQHHGCFSSQSFWNRGSERNGSHKGSNFRLATVTLAGTSRRCGIGEERCRLFGVWGGVRFAHSRFSFLSSWTQKRRQWLAGTLELPDQASLATAMGEHSVEVCMDGEGFLARSAAESGFEPRRLRICFYLWKTTVFGLPCTAFRTDLGQNGEARWWCANSTLHS